MLPEEKEIRTLYKRWPEVRSYLVKQGCDKMLAEDIFQEALLVYMRKRKQDDFDLQVEPIFYIKTTCKFLWYNEARKQQKSRTTEYEPEIADCEPEEMEELLERELYLRKVEKTLELIGEKCKELLVLYYFGKQSMLTIAEKLGLRNDKVAKAQKYKCVQKAKEQLNLIIPSSHEY